MCESVKIINFCLFMNALFVQLVAIMKVSFLVMMIQKD